MLRKSPRVIDYLALLLRFVAIIIAITLLYGFSEKAGIEILAMICLMLGEVYHVVALAIAVVYPQKRPFVYSIVGALDSVLLVLGIWFIGNTASDAYLLMLIILVPLVLSGGFVTSVVIALTSGGLYFYTLSLLSFDPLSALVRLTILVIVPLVIGVLSEHYHRKLNLLAEINEENVVRTHADAIREKFSIITSRNLRALLLSTKGYLELLNKSSITRDATVGTVERIIEQVSQLESLMEQLLRLSAINAVIPVEDRSKLNIVNLTASIVREYSEKLNRQHKIIQFDSDQKDARVILHERLFREAIKNIINNAHQVIGIKGKILVKLRVDVNHVILSISDDGPGIAGEDLSEIFTKFREITFNGGEDEDLGIGLYIAKSIIEAHEGTISVESVLGQGSTCTITLPRVLV